MAALNTQTDTMASAANHVVDIAQQVQQEMNGLQMRLGSLDAAWQGSAKMAFDQLMVRWQDSGRRLNESPNSIAETIRANSAAYQAAQDDHLAQINSLNI
ncbi:MULTISPECIES: WXG100 family type VII secretion target [Lawsonella]|jgi:WXG100 family type VII secretion target|uniref:ESAT-6-like protein n=1 Tax=Lawsonella clevelandensis TaxID=1528099 RepID=A0A2W5KFF9_9ACTN|nr:MULTISPECIES: WXG100 family type VII secretion target [Lawsonella]PZP88289.1 MAG: WXG100 family type VII secretion target [Lawsonella clevelandensis]